MYSELYQYLLQHKELPVPGIGTFLLERKAAVIDFPNKKINPPSYAISMQQGSHLPGKSFFAWLASTLKVSDRDAVFQFNDFAVELKKQISTGDIINWGQMGTLSKGLGGDVKFVPAELSSAMEHPISAERIIRQKSEHMVRVGEDQKTSAEMVEMLSQTDEKKSYWWAYAMAISLLAIVFIGWYFSTKGVELSSAANTCKAIIQEAPVTYSILP